MRDDQWISEKLREVMVCAEQPALNSQDRIAEMVAEVIDDALWQAQFDNPRSGPALERLMEKASAASPKPAADALPLFPLSLQEERPGVRTL